MPKYMKIEPAGRVTIVELNGLDDLRGAVGGCIEGIGSPVQRDVYCYINEDGKGLGLTANRTAELFLNTIGVSLYGNDWISGAMIVCGTEPPDGGLADGEDYDVPLEYAAEMLAAWQTESQMWGEG